MKFGREIWQIIITKIRLVIVKIYFREIQVYHKNIIPKDDFKIYVCNHRNGAIDGFVLMNLLGNYKAIVGNNLTKNKFLKFFFGGQIDIFRKAETEDEKRYNQQQMKYASKLIKEGIPVLVFPEGTSKLGPSLLPIKKGAAFICTEILESMTDKQKLCIVPIGLHYEAGWQFRSRAEIHVGEPLVLNKGEGGTLTELTRKIKGLLETITANFENNNQQLDGECIATIVRNQEVIYSHQEICRYMAAKKLPEELWERYINLKDRFGYKQLRYYHHLYGEKIKLHYITYCLLTPIILIALIINILPITACLFVSVKMADDTNVIALWRILTGAPLFALQFIIYLFSCLYLAESGLVLLTGYILITGLAVLMYDYWRYLSYHIIGSKRGKGEIRDYALDLISHFRKIKLGEMNK